MHHQQANLLERVSTFQLYCVHIYIVGEGYLIAVFAIKAMFEEQQEMCDSKRRGRIRSKGE